MTGGFVRQNLGPAPRARQPGPDDPGDRLVRRLDGTVGTGVYGVLMEHVEVRRSRRRRRSVTAFREGETIVVAIPARFTRAE